MSKKVDFFFNNQYQTYQNFYNPIFKNLDPRKSIEFHRFLENYVPTPLLSLKDWASEYFVKKVWLKDESKRFQKNTFKTLGASYAIHQYLEKYPPKENEKYTFCTATDGNHGLSVAWAAKNSGHKAIIFVPEEMKEARRNAILKENATLQVIDGDYDEVVQVARIEAEKKQWHLIQDTAWRGYEEIPSWVMAGYMTHFRELEILLHLPIKPRIDVVFLQAGVGSWAAAATWYYHQKYKEKRPKIVIVEPYESDCLLESAKNKRLASTQKSQETIAAGLNCGTPSLLAWEIMQKGVDAFISIDDDFVRKTMKKLYQPASKNTPQVISGESGAAGLAGFVALMEAPEFEELKGNLEITEESIILAYNTEGDTDPEHFKEIVET